MHWIEGGYDNVFFRSKVPFDLILYTRLPLRTSNDREHRSESHKHYLYASQGWCNTSEGILKCVEYEKCNDIKVSLLSTALFSTGHIEAEAQLRLQGQIDIRESHPNFTQLSDVFEIVIKGRVSVFASRIACRAKAEDPLFCPYSSLARSACPEVLRSV